MTRKIKAKPKSKPRRGGKRPGAGRPTKDRHLEEYDQIGPPPMKADPIDRCVWAQRLAALCVWRVATGVEVPERAARIFSGVNTVVRAVPMERLKAVEEALEDDADELDDYTGPATVPVMDPAMPLSGPPPRMRAR